MAEPRRLGNLRYMAIGVTGFGGSGARIEG
jgi:hypothetical protein